MTLPILWRTTHGINRTVIDAVKGGTGFPVKSTELIINSNSNSNSNNRGCIPISYGILRGTSLAFAAAREAGNDWWEIDNGYFKRGHFDGYYRISRNGLCARYDGTKARELSDERFNALGLDVKAWCNDPDGYVLLCPPTPAIEEFYGMSPGGWERVSLEILQSSTKRAVKTRRKDAAEAVSATPLQDDIKGAYCVLTFNSNVAIDALIMGVPAVTGVYHPVREWNNLDATSIGKLSQEKMRDFDRMGLFKFLAHCQYTLEEMQRPATWKRIFSVQGSAHNIPGLYSLEVAE